ncbi:MAG: DUF4129 domain-containing protein, partial [Anaerolineae bacterium]|nr:DUF4129 domain-containing protein [Anaerolineae bacterium]
AVLLVSFGGLAAVLIALYLSTGTRVPLWDARWLGALLDDPAPSVVVLVVAIVLWRWGILAGRERVLYDTFAFNFALGVMAFVIALAVAFSTNVVSLYELVLPVLFFFAIGLGALALSSLQDARRYEGGRTGQQIALNRYWLGTVGVIIGALLLGGVLLTQFFAPDYLAGILNVLTLILNWLAQILFLVLIVVTFVVFTILEFFARLFPSLQISSRAQDLRTPTLFEPFKDWEQATHAPSPQVYAVLQILAGVILAGVIVLIFAWAFRRFRYLDEEEIEETRETIFSFDLVREQLAQLLRRPRAESSRAPFVALDADDPRAQIRRTYQALLAWADARGVSRAPGMTPYEYARALEREPGIDRAALTFITRAYVEARYSAASVDATRAQEVARAWQQIVQSKEGQ